MVDHLISSNILIGIMVNFYNVQKNTIGVQEPPRIIKDDNESQIDTFNKLNSTNWELDLSIDKMIVERPEYIPDNCIVYGDFF